MVASPIDRRTHLERINPTIGGAAKPPQEEFMTKEQFEALLAHMEKLLAPVIAVAQIQLDMLADEKARREAFAAEEAKRKEEADAIAAAEAAAATKKTKS